MRQNYNIYFWGSLIPSLFIFLFILYPLVNLKNNVEQTNSETIVEVNITLPSDKQLEHEAYLNNKQFCSSSRYNCKELINKEVKDRKEKFLQEKQELEQKSLEKDKGFIDYILDTNYLILFIYFLIIMALNFQVSILVYLKLGNIEKLDKEFEDIVDWTINTPPILGVLGTIISFSILVAQNGDIQEGFSKSFFEAALTTIAGGFIYTLNMFLKIFIAKHISPK